MDQAMLRTEENIRLLRLPVEAEENDPLGRKPGEPLCPELGKDKKWLEQFKRSYLADSRGGQRAWRALYQCSPRREEGNLIRREWWQFYDKKAVTAFEREVISVDAAFKGAGFDAQRDRIDLKEAMAKDAQALYAEVRGDRGGIGAAQYDSISNAAAENRLAVSQEQRRLAADTAAKIAQLRAQGEYEKAEKALELTQDYLGRLTGLAQWAAEYDLSAAKFRENVSQWRAEYEAEQQKLEGQRLEQEAGQAETVRKNLAQTGKTLLELGIMPGASQLAALGMDENQARSYLAVGKAAGKTGSSGNASGRKIAADRRGGEYALYLDAMESSGDPRTYVKSHYKAYGLSALPEASAYERWRSGLAEPMDMEGFETFLRKLSISLSEDPISGTNAMTAKHWPTMTAAQRKSTEEVYETYGKRYVYGS